MTLYIVVRAWMYKPAAGTRLNIPLLTFVLENANIDTADKNQL